MLARFHRRVQVDLNEIFAKYSDVSEVLSDGFLQNFRWALRRPAATRSSIISTQVACGAAILIDFPITSSTTSVATRFGSGLSGMISGTRVTDCDASRDDHGRSTPSSLLALPGPLLGLLESGGEAR